MTEVSFIRLWDMQAIFVLLFCTLQFVNNLFRVIRINRNKMLNFCSFSWLSLYKK